MFHSSENTSNVDCGIVVEKESVEKREKKLEDVSKMRRILTHPPITLTWFLVLSQLHAKCFTLR